MNEALKSKIFQALGAASMCWSEIPKGIFDSTRAKLIGDTLCSVIEEAYGRQDAIVPLIGQESVVSPERNAEIKAFVSSDSGIDPCRCGATAPDEHTYYCKNAPRSSNDIRPAAERHADATGYLRESTPWKQAFNSFVAKQSSKETPK